jgi:hypothetical protein
MIIDHIGSHVWPRRLDQISFGKRFLLAAVATVGVTAVASGVAAFDQAGVVVPAPRPAAAVIKPAIVGSHCAPSLPTIPYRRPGSRDPIASSPAASGLYVSCVSAEPIDRLIRGTG